MTEVSAKVKDERLWGTLAQLSGFVGYVIPFGNIVAPLIIWLVKKDESKFVGDAAKESTNFQISITIYTLVAAVLMFTIILIPVSLIAIFGLMIFEIIVMIQAAIAANKGELYKYPLTLRFIQ